MQDTIIKVGTTEIDEYGNLLVTPSGGGDKIKIAQKRTHLHHLFEQGNTVALHWETYMNKSYVANANLVEGELPTIVKQAEKLGGTLAEITPQADAKMTKEDWAEKERITRKSIERQTSLKEAVNVAVAEIDKGKEMTPAKIIELAKRFCKYLDTGE